jgi:hypothetical protein
MLDIWDPYPVIALGGTFIDIVNRQSTAVLESNNNRVGTFGI